MCFFRLGTELLELIVVVYGGFVQPAINLQDIFCMEKTLFMALNPVTAINYSYAILQYSTRVLALASHSLGKTSLVLISLGSTLGGSLRITTELFTCCLRNQ